MSNLQLSLFKEHFDKTKAGIKKEDYREINAYWCNRLLLQRGKPQTKAFWERCYIGLFKENAKSTLKKFFECQIIHQITAKPFDKNIMTLGYPKSTDKDRVLELEHKGIEIREGNPEWGAEPGVLYFCILHGEIL
jgi:hypothetical protein